MGEILLDVRFPTYSLVYFAQFANFSLDGIICFPGRSFGTMGVFYPYLVTGIKVGFCLGYRSCDPYFHRTFLDLAYFQQDVVKPIFNCYWVEA